MLRTPRKRPTDVLTPVELEIMNVLWEVGSGTVSDVQAKLPSDLAYTTVQTMLGVLLRKNKVRRSQDGRAFSYQAAESREGAVGAALNDLVARMFGGSAEALLMALVDTRRITPKEIARAQALLGPDDGSTEEDEP
jgi:BlaI family penicillinase repressor